MEELPEESGQGGVLGEKSSDFTDLRPAVTTEDKSSWNEGCDSVIGDSFSSTPDSFSSTPDSFSSTPDSFSSTSVEKTSDHQAACTASGSSWSQETSKHEDMRRDVLEERRKLGGCVQQRDSGCYSPAVDEAELALDAATSSRDIRSLFCSVPHLLVKDVTSRESADCESVLMHDRSERERDKSWSPADVTSGGCIDEDGNKDRLSSIFRNSENTGVQVSINEKKAASPTRSMNENQHRSLQGDVDDDALNITRTNEAGMREVDGVHEPKKGNVYHNMDTDDVSSLRITDKSTLGARAHSTDGPRPAGEIILDLASSEIDAAARSSSMTDGSTSSSSGETDKSQQVHATAAARKSAREIEQRSFSDSLNSFTSELRRRAAEERTDLWLPAGPCSRSNKRKLEPQSSCDSHFQILRSKSEYQEDVLSTSGRVLQKRRPSNKHACHYFLPSSRQKEGNGWKASAVIRYSSPSNNTAPNPACKNRPLLGSVKQQGRNYDLSLSLRASPGARSVLQKPVPSRDSSIPFQSEALSPFDRWANKTMSFLELGALRVGSNFVVDKCCLANTHSLLEELCKFLLNPKAKLDRRTRFLKQDKAHEAGNVQRRPCTLQVDCATKGIHLQSLTLADTDWRRFVGSCCRGDASNASQYCITADLRLLQQDCPAVQLPLNHAKRKYCDVSKAEDEGRFRVAKLGGSACSSQCCQVVQRASCPLLGHPARAWETNLNRRVLACSETWKQTDLRKTDEEERRLLRESESRRSQTLNRTLLRKRKGCRIRRVANKSTLNFDIGSFKERIKKLTRKDFEQDCLAADNVQSETIGASLLSDLKKLISEVNDTEDTLLKTCENLDHWTASTRLSADVQTTHTGKENSEVEHVEAHTEAGHAVVENIDNQIQICEGQKRAAEGGITHTTATTAEKEKRVHKKSVDENPSADIISLDDCVLNTVPGKHDLKKLKKTMDDEPSDKRSGSVQPPTKFSSSLVLQHLPSPASKVSSVTKCCCSFQCESENKNTWAAKKTQHRAGPYSKCDVVWDKMDSMNLHPLSEFQPSVLATVKEDQQQNYPSDRTTLPAEHNISSVQNSSDCKVNPGVPHPLERKQLQSPSKTEAAFPGCSQDVSKLVGSYPLLAFKKDGLLQVCSDTGGKVVSQCTRLQRSEPVTEASAGRQKMSTNTYVLDEDSANKRMCLRGLRVVNKRGEDSEVCDCRLSSHFLKELGVSEVSGSFFSNVLSSECLAGSHPKSLPKIDCDRMEDQDEWKTCQGQGSNEDLASFCSVLGTGSVADEWNRNDPHLELKMFTKCVKQAKAPNSRYEQHRTEGASSLPHSWDTLQAGKGQPTKVTSVNNALSYVASRSRILMLSRSSSQNVADGPGFESAPSPRSDTTSSYGTGRREPVCLHPLPRAITKNVEGVATSTEELSHAGGHYEANADQCLIADLLRPAEQKGRIHQDPPSLNESLALPFQHLTLPMMSLTNSTHDAFPSVQQTPNTCRFHIPQKMVQPPPNLGKQQTQRHKIQQRQEVFPSFCQVNLRPLCLRSFLRGGRRRLANQQSDQQRLANQQSDQRRLANQQSDQQRLANQQSDQQPVEHAALKLRNFKSSEALQAPPAVQSVRTEAKWSCTTDEAWENSLSFLDWNPSEVMENPLRRLSPFTVNLSLSIWSPGYHASPGRDVFSEVQNDAWPMFSHSLISEWRAEENSCTSGCHLCRWTT